ncbi:MAG: bifunctional 3-deoxy-7-phosphoheptulonate synthase/chorismate mutase [Planctomycetes bacterium]|nr:bifunctional 3-deoxy-7-phosphoheptulonate synthase/chorismate mutase [Planctomycetota bacterium]
MDPLSQPRADIDRLDRELVRLLAERLEAVRAIGSAKGRDPSAPLRDEERERALFAAWARAAEEHGVSSYFAGRVLREVLNWSRRDQERFLEPMKQGGPRAVRVGYQGVPASYSDLAAQKHFATRDVARLERIGYRGFAAVADALEAGEIDYALLPIENTIAGSIDEVYDLLGARRMTIVGEEVWSVEHCLLGLPGASTEDLRVVRSHPVALMQCTRFLEGLVGVRSESFHDTAGAAEAVARDGDRHVAAIASEEAAREYGLVVLRRDVANQPTNITRFLLLARERESFDPRRPALTSLTFALNHRHGALLECLKVFEANELNLTKLESRPRPEAAWEYQFYVDFQGHLDEPRVAAALEGLRAHVNHLQVLGSYPRRAEEGLELAGRARVPLEVAEPPTAAGVPAPGTAADGAKPAPTTPAGAACPAQKVNPNLKLVTRREGQADTIVDVSGVAVGGTRFVLALGPCAVENRAQVLAAAEMVKRCGAALMRGGAFKPRTSPYAFQGLGFEGLAYLREAGRAYELPIVTEVLHPEDVERVAEQADVLQIGARNMQNFALLKEVGRARRPVLLKRGMSATIEELLLAAEYVLAGGNQRVILCERGIRTFETATRNTFDVSAIPVLKSRTHLPVLADPSHAAGRRDLVVALSLAAAAAGADGLIVECHPNPSEALCDKDQALAAADVAELVARLGPVVAAVGRTL